MKINENLSILFWLWRSKASKDGAVPIYVRITVSGDRDGFSSGRKIRPNYWNEKTSTPLKVCPEGRAINAYINKVIMEVEKLYNDLSKSGKKLTAKMLKDAYFPKTNIEKTLMQAFKLHNAEFAEKVSMKKGTIGTLNRYLRLEQKVKAFLIKKYKMTDIALDDIQIALATNFYHYLIMENIGENTSMKCVKTLKQIIDRAVAENWIKHNVLKGFKCTYIDPDRQILEQHEIMKIYKKDIPIQRLAEVRDVYLFCVFTGYAYETTYNLAPDNIFKGLDGKLWITKDRSKTDTAETVPLLPIALEIVLKYENHPYCVENNKLLPVNSNYRYNAYLKELADICGIKKHLTTHTARHTFATTVTLENDVPLETVSKMLGHRDLRSTQTYAKITKRKISNNMKDLERKIFCDNGNLKEV